MLRELAVENFALIGTLRLAFGPHLTVLTGETGAGKSIIIDALSAALGERVGADSIRGGESTARVEAVFDASDAPRALEALERLGLRDGEDPTLILSREITSGRSSYRVNRRATTQAVVQELGRYLVDIHGQHEHQALIHESNHLSFLDALGGPQHLSLRQAYEAEFAQFQAVRQALHSLRQGERERAQRLDMLRFQVAEIEAAALQPEEEEQLAAERTRLVHAERLRQGAGSVRELLDGETLEGVSAVAALETAARQLRNLAPADPQLGRLAEEVEGAAVIVAEAVHSLGRYLQELEAEPERLEQVEQRLEDIARLKRKYGDSVAEIIAYGQRAAAELAQITDAEETEAQLTRELEQRRARAGELAEQLSASREQLARRLEELVVGELAGLGMEAAALVVELTRTEDPDGLCGKDGRRYAADSRGCDTCRLLFSANAGEPVRPLSKVASGGELSRLMLVFKSLCSRGAEIPTIVFDEIDAGIGGRVAHAVGQRLAQVSDAAQVLCVTHLAQIARVANHHVVVTKQVADGRTTVQARTVEGEERVAEVARMLGAQEDDDTARQHARELLESAATNRRRVQGRPGGSAVRV